MSDRKPNDRFANRFRKPRDGKSEEEESGEEETDLTVAFESEMDALASVVEELEDTLVVQDVQDLRELSESMHEGLATIRETHAKLREKNEEWRLSAFLVCLLSRSFRFTKVILQRQWPRKRENETFWRSVQQKKLLTSRFDCNLFGHWSGDPICPAKDTNDAQTLVTSCILQETLLVYPESFVTSSTSVEQELGGARACDTCCNRTVAGQEWMNDYVHSLNKLKLKYWTLPCEERFKFGAGDPVVCNTAYFIPVLIHGACAIMRVSVVPGKLMLLIGKDTLKVLEARSDLKNDIGIFPGAGDFEGKVLREKPRRSLDGSIVA